MCPTLFNQEQTKKVRNNVRELFSNMTPEFREHLMHSFMWTQDKLEEYLRRDGSLQGDELKDAYSHLESLLARIESFASEKSKTEFPSYEQWVDDEYQKYKEEHWEDHEDIERLMDEGGVVAPGKTSPMETMANDSLSHYNFQKSEHDASEHRSKEAIALMQSPAYKSLLFQAGTMHDTIMDGIKHRR